MIKIIIILIITITIIILTLPLIWHACGYTGADLVRYVKAWNWISTIFTNLNNIII